MLHEEKDHLFSKRDEIQAKSARENVKKEFYIKLIFNVIHPYEGANINFKTFKTFHKEIIFI